jgi:PEP-CTERM motif
MKRVALILLLLGVAVGAWATPVPVATLTLDSGQPVGCFVPGVECFDYTLSVTNGTIADVHSVTINSVGGVFPFEINFIGWTETVSGSNVTFTNPGGVETGHSLDGFLIESSDTTTVPGTYSYVLGSDPGPFSVPVPGTPAATPEPATVGVVGLGLLAIAGARKRFASR